MNVTVNYYISKGIFNHYMLANHAIRSPISHVGYEPIIQNSHIPFICGDCPSCIRACIHIQVILHIWSQVSQLCNLVSQVLTVSIGSSVFQMSDFGLLNFNCTNSVLRYHNYVILVSLLVEIC